MSLSPGCPRCPAPVLQADDRWTCPDHGEVAPLWRPLEASYDEFGDHLRAADGFPTLTPWPLGPGWSITDFAVVGAESRSSRATMSCISGTSAQDGPVDVIVVSEEPGTGLGARVAGTRHDDPGHEVGEGPPMVKIRVEHQPLSLWPVSTSDGSREWDRSVLAGESGGRWLWLVLRPASAVLLLRPDWVLRDLSALGPGLLAVPFGGPAPAW
ncbi:DUF6758 family protein [Nocardioides lijunqiniae]|uniref:DUF6758 family protein n=1 Tax=Nocardioides lijunqiniae TaxID=2760832 RepID=UPI0018775ECC|nr:DUF6758 family protein [Nocardioides lijunqiniae]